MEQASCICPNSHIEKSIRSPQDALYTILDRATQGETVRIWYSHNPDEMCGFLDYSVSFHSMKCKA